MGYPRSISTNIKRQLEDAALAGRIYTCSIGLVALTTAAYLGLSIFNPASTRKFIIVSAKGFNSASTNQVYLRLTTTNPALGTGVTILNNMPGGPSSLATGSMASGSVALATGTLFKDTAPNTNTSMAQTEMLTKDSEYIILPAGQNNGVLVLINGAVGNNCLAEFVWAEI